MWKSRNENKKVEITTSDIRAAFDRLMSAVEARHGTRVNLEKDYYFEVDVSQAYSSDVNHADHIIAGQLSDDVEEIAEFLERDADETYIWHDLGHLVGILRYLVFMDESDNRDELPVCSRARD